MTWRICDTERWVDLQNALPRGAGRACMGLTNPSGIYRWILESKLGLSMEEIGLYFYYSNLNFLLTLLATVILKK